MSYSKIKNKSFLPCATLKLFLKRHTLVIMIGDGYQLGAEETGCNPVWFISRMVEEVSTVRSQDGFEIVQQPENKSCIWMCLPLFQVKACKLSTGQFSCLEFTELCFGAGWFCGRDPERAERSTLPSLASDSFYFTVWGPTRHELQININSETPFLRGGWSFLVFILNNTTFWTWKN